MYVLLIVIPQILSISKACLVENFSNTCDWLVPLEGEGADVVKVELVVELATATAAAGPTPNRRLFAFPGVGELKRSAAGTTVAPPPGDNSSEAGRRG